jgi:hypothetical protein
MVAPSRYRTGLSAKVGLLDETFTALQLIQSGKTESEIKMAVMVDDLLRKATHERRKAIWEKIHQCYFQDWKRVSLLSKPVAKTNY